MQICIRCIKSDSNAFSQSKRMCEGGSPEKCITSKCSVHVLHSYMLYHVASQVKILSANQLKVLNRFLNLLSLNINTKLQTYTWDRKHKSNI